MKPIAALLLSTVALLSFGDASGAERWGWSSVVAKPGLWPAAKQSSWVPVDALTMYDADAARIKIVPLELQPAATKVPGALAGVMPQLDEAIEAVRTIVAQDPALLTNLKARGLSPDDVVGLSHTPSGEITLFVAGQA